jgi:hypothetical protein
MSGKTVPQLTAAAAISDADLLTIYQGAGPLKKVTASEFAGYVNQANNSANAAPIWLKAQANSGDIYDLTIGDSTGDATTEWVYSGKLDYYKTNFPEFTVKYRTFSVSTGWGAYATVQTGTGNPTIGQTYTIYVDNASVAGSSIKTFLGDVQLLLYAEGIAYDNIDVSLSQNWATSPVITVNSVREQFVSFVSLIKQLQPQAGVFILLGSTEITNDASIQKSKNVVAGLLAATSLLGTGIIDVYSLFSAQGNAASLYTDGLHPSASGTLLYIQAWEAAHAIPSVYDTVGSILPSAYDTSRPLLWANADFSDWPDGQEFPTGWTFSNCTVEKDASKAGIGKYAVKVTITGANATMTRDLDFLTPEMLGVDVNANVWAWIPSGVDRTLAGRLDLTFGDGVNPSTSAITAAYGNGFAEDYWYPAFTSVRVPKSPYPATQGTLTVYLGPATTADNGEFLWLRSCTGTTGIVPAPVLDATQAAGIIGDGSGIEPPASLGLRAAMNSDGSVAAAGAGNFAVTMVGTAPALTDQYLKGEDAQGNTKTDYAWYSFTLPDSYRAGQNLNLAINGEIVVGSGTLGTKTIKGIVVAKDSAGNLGSDIASSSQTFAITNYLLYSQDFTNAAWPKVNITVTAGQSDPFGGSNASKIEATATAATDLRQSLVVSASTITASIYAKQGSGASVANSFILRNVTTSQDLLFITINYSTGVIQYNALSVLDSGASAEDVGSGWWRISLTVSSGVTPGNTVRIYPAFAGSSQTAGAFAYLIGGQIEYAQSAGAYVVTTSAAAFSTVASDYNFTVTGTGLEAGDDVLVGVSAVVQETGGANPSYARINSLRLGDL